MKNKLTDLNDHLFAQLERLSDESVRGSALKEELNRSKGITAMAQQIISNANLVLAAEVAKGDGIIRKTPGMLGLEKSDI